MRAVEPDWFTALTAAPATRSFSMIVIFPLWAAAEIGVTPFLLDKFGSAPALIRASTASTNWFLMQWVSTVSSFEVKNNNLVFKIDSSKFSHIWQSRINIFNTRSESRWPFKKICNCFSERFWSGLWSQEIHDRIGVSIVDIKLESFWNQLIFRHTQKNQRTGFKFQQSFDETLKLCWRKICPFHVQKLTVPNVTPLVSEP